MVPCIDCYTQCPQPCSRPPLTQDSIRGSSTLQASLGQSLVGSLLHYPGSLCTQISVCAVQESVSPVLYKCWHFCSGVNGGLLKKGLCHTQIYFTQRPCPCISPLLIHTSPRDTQTQFCLSLCGFSGSWFSQGLFEPSEGLWWVWGLILNMILPLLPSCWGFSALGHGVSPHNHSSTMQSPLQPSFQQVCPNFPWILNLDVHRYLKICKSNTELTISSHFTQNQNETNQNTTCSASQFSYLQYTAI